MGQSSEQRARFWMPAVWLGCTTSCISTLKAPGSTSEDACGLLGHKGQERTENDCPKSHPPPKVPVCHEKWRSKGKSVSSSACHRGRNHYNSLNVIVRRCTSLTWRRICILETCLCLWTTLIHSRKNSAPPLQPSSVISLAFKIKISIWSNKNTLPGSR